MIEYDRIDVAEGIDLTKNNCHDMSMKANSMHNLAIAYNNGSAYRINFLFMSKNDALNLMKNALIIGKRGVL